MPDSTRLRGSAPDAVPPAAGPGDAPDTGTKPAREAASISEQAVGDSMFRNAYALMLSTGVSAALGLGFWLLAARYYTEEAVGQGSAAIAAMRLLASITATTMIGAVVRYVPRAGRATGPLVLRAYAASSVVVCVVCVVFLLTLDLWGRSYAPLDGLTAGLIFTASCIAWALLTLQDGVLTGLRQAVWVPVGNAVFSIGKLLLLAVFATAMPVLGVFVSWAAAIALSVVPLGWLVFRRLIPRQAAADHDRVPLKASDIGRFLAGDSVGALFSLAMINLLPVMVAVRFDSAHNAFFYTAYTVGGTMEFMAINMASSLTAHASYSPAQLTQGVRGALRRMTVLLVPVVMLLVVFAPHVLSRFGPEYATQGTTVLRLLALAALPRVVVELYIGVLRVQGRTGMLAALQGTMCVLVLGSAMVLLGRVGITGAGLAMLTSMTLMALVAAPGLRAALRGRDPGPSWLGRVLRRGGERDPYGTNWARAAALHRSDAVADAAEYGTDWAGQTAYLHSLHDTATPAFGLPMYTRQERRYRTGPRVGTGTPAAPGEGRLVSLLWWLLGLAAGLFWAPLVRTGDVRREHLSGSQLLDVLPPLTLVGGVLLVVVQCAALALVTLRRALLALSLLITFAALHTAPLLLGVSPDRASGPGAHLVTDFLARIPGPADPDAVARALPVSLQLVCLWLAALTLWALRADGRTTAAAVWLLLIAGWTAQHVFASTAVPVFLGLLATALVSSGVRFGRGRRAARTGRRVR